MASTAHNAKDDEHKKIALESILVGENIARRLDRLPELNSIDELPPELHPGINLKEDVLPLMEAKGVHITDWMLRKHYSNKLARLLFLDAFSKDEDDLLIEGMVEGKTYREIAADKFSWTRGPDTLYQRWKNTLKNTDAAVTAMAAVPPTKKNDLDRARAGRDADFRAFRAMMTAEFKRRKGIAERMERQRAAREAGPSSSPPAPLEENEREEEVERAGPPSSGAAEKKKKKRARPAAAAAPAAAASRRASSSKKKAKRSSSARAPDSEDDWSDWSSSSEDDEGEPWNSGGASDDDDDYDEGTDSDSEDSKG